MKWIIALFPAVILGIIIYSNSSNWEDEKYTLKEQVHIAQKFEIDAEESLDAANEYIHSLQKQVEGKDLEITRLREDVKRKDEWARKKLMNEIFEEMPSPIRGESISKEDQDSLIKQRAFFEATRAIQMKEDQDQRH